jgi:RsiW-degrading membrane proteinase PrsW (M82 family)
MLGALNKIFLALILMLALAAISISILTLFFPMLLGGDSEHDAFSFMDNRSDFSLQIPTEHISPADSPDRLNITVRTPTLRESDLVFIDVYGGGRQLAHVDCLKGEELNHTGFSELTCEVPIPYDYAVSSDYRIYGILTSDGKEYSSGPSTIASDWTSYESDFWGFSESLAIIIAGIYLVIVLPVLLLVWFVAWNTKHDRIDPGEYSLGSLINLAGKGMAQKFHSFLVSPYFWALESLGILIIVLYMAISARVWESSTALVAFALSGLLSFFIPFLWCSAWWYADYKEREPLRIMLSFFLWGMLSGLMAIGLNTVAGALLGVIGLGFFSTFLLAPPMEEFFKGSGLALLSGHHEYDSIEDGIVFGFTIGMGFSFIENWVYLLNNPMGSDIWGWLWVFILRSIIFSANHGFFTALTGIVIGYLVERRFQAPALGLLVGVPLAAFFHAMHNSGETIIALLGGGGALIYCCFLIPFFDYGGFVILILLFIRAVIRIRSGP